MILDVKCQRHDLTYFKIFEYVLNIRVILEYRVSNISIIGHENMKTTIRINCADGKKPRTK